MARRLWEQITAGTDIKLWVDPEPYNKTDDEAERDRLQAILDASVDIRTELAICLGYTALADFDSVIADQRDDVKDRIDYYSYLTKVENLTVMDGAWFSPDLVDSSCGETGGNVDDNAADANTTTFWRHDVDHEHSITFKLRDYDKKITKIRFRHAGAEPAREQLANITVRASQALGMIDDAGNILDTGLNPTWTGFGNDWVEVDITNKPRARFIKLEFDSTSNGNNFCQIREFEVFVETRDP